jgi:hypothetical protein
MHLPQHIRTGFAVALILGSVAACDAVLHIISF